MVQERYYLYYHRTSNSTKNSDVKSARESFVRSAPREWRTRARARPRGRPLRPQLQLRPSMTAMAKTAMGKLSPRRASWRPGARRRSHGAAAGASPGVERLPTGVRLSLCVRASVAEGLVRGHAHALAAASADALEAGGAGWPMVALVLGQRSRLRERLLSGHQRMKAGPPAFLDGSLARLERR